jgi:polyisoprenoid-binding protein YceI
MVKRVLLAGVIVTALVVGVLWSAFNRPVAEASESIEAIPVEFEARPSTIPAPPEGETTDESAVVVPDVTEPMSRDEAGEVGESAQEAPEAIASPSAPSEGETTATPETAIAGAAEPIIYEIEQEASEARYVIDEVLRGSPTTVVGRTNQVAGQIAVDPANPGTTQVGAITVNARTFTTDQSRRDNAVQNWILQTGQYEYIIFEPASLIGLPERAEAGETFSFQIVGNLTIRDVTHEATWDVTVTPVSESRLEGSATATGNYVEWGLTIPDVPFVANVSDQVRLELEWVATT